MKPLDTFQFSYLTLVFSYFICRTIPQHGACWYFWRNRKSLYYHCFKLYYIKEFTGECSKLLYNQFSSIMRYLKNFIFHLSDLIHSHCKLGNTYGVYSTSVSTSKAIYLRIKIPGVTKLVLCCFHHVYEPLPKCRIFKC